MQKALLEEAKEQPKKETEDFIQKTDTLPAPRTSALITRASVKREEESKGLLSHRGSKPGDDLWE